MKINITPLDRNKKIIDNKLEDNNVISTEEINTPPSLTNNTKNSGIYSQNSDLNSINAKGARLDESQDAMPAPKNNEAQSEIQTLVKVKTTLSQIAKRYQLNDKYEIYDEMLEENLRDYKDGFLSFNDREDELNFQKEILISQLDWKLDQLSKLAIANKKFTMKNIFSLLANKYISQNKLDKKILSKEKNLILWQVIAKLDLLNQSILKKEVSKNLNQIKPQENLKSTLSHDNPINFMIKSINTLENRVEQALRPQRQPAVKTARIEKLEPIASPSFVEETNEIINQIKKNDNPNFKGTVIRIGRSPSFKTEEREKNFEHGTIQLESDNTVSRNQLEITFNPKGGFSLKNLSSSGTSFNTKASTDTYQLRDSLNLKLNHTIRVGDIEIRMHDPNHLIIANKVISNKNGRAILVSENAKEYYESGLGAYPNFEFSQRSIGDCYLLAALYTGMKFGVINIDRMIDTQKDGSIHVYIPKIITGPDGQELLSYREKPPIIIPADADVGRLNRKCYDEKGRAYYLSPLRVDNAPKSLEEKIQIIEYAYGKKVKLNNLKEKAKRGFSQASLRKLRIQDTRFHMSGGSSKTALSELIGGSRNDIPRISLNTVEPDSIDLIGFHKVAQTLIERYGRFTFTAGVNNHDQRPFGAQTYRDSLGHEYSDPDLRFNRGHAYAAELFSSMDGSIKIIIRNPHLTDLNAPENQSIHPKSLVMSLDEFYKHFDRFYFCDTDRFEKLMSIGEGSKSLYVAKESHERNETELKAKDSISVPKKIERAKVKNENKQIHINNQINGLLYVNSLLLPAFANFGIENPEDSDDAILEILFDGQSQSEQYTTILNFVENRFNKLASYFGIKWDDIEVEDSDASFTFYKSENDELYQKLSAKIESLIHKISNKFEPTDKAGGKDLMNYHRSMAKVQSSAPGVPDISQLGFLCHSAKRIYQISTLIKQGFFE